MKLTTKQIKQLIKEELSNMLRESEYGEEFDYSAKLPMGHGKTITYKSREKNVAPIVILDPKDEENKPFYDGIHNKILANFDWLSNEIIENNLDVTKKNLFRELDWTWYERARREQSPSAEDGFDDFFDNKFNKMEFYRGYYIIIGLAMAAADESSAFSYPRWLDIDSISRRLTEENPDGILEEIDDEKIRLISFMKDLFYRRLGIPDQLYNDIVEKGKLGQFDTLNQYLTSYEGPQK